MILGIIPARGGSKRLPGKNRKPLCGKPLIWWTISEAMKSQALNRVVVSTDDPEIFALATEMDCEVVHRPAWMASDDAPIYLEIFRLIDLYSPEWVVLLQPTSPLRTVDDIDACVTKCIRAPAPSLVSVTKGSPAANGAVYVALVEWLREHRNFDGPRTIVHEMPPERSVDINTQADFDRAEQFMLQRAK